MTSEIAGAVAVLAAVLVVTVLVTVRRRRAQAAVLVAAEPEAALLSSAAALRRLGARITRYDGEGGTLEARLAQSSAIVRVRADAKDGGTTRVRLEGDAGARPVIRRFRRTLSMSSTG